MPRSSSLVRRCQDWKRPVAPGAGHSPFAAAAAGKPFIFFPLAEEGPSCPRCRNTSWGGGGKEDSRRNRRCAVGGGPSCPGSSSKLAARGKLPGIWWLTRRTYIDVWPGLWRHLANNVSKLFFIVYLLLTCFLSLCMPALDSWLLSGWTCLGLHQISTPLVEHDALLLTFVYSLPLGTFSGGSPLDSHWRTTLDYLWRTPSLGLPLADLLPWTTSGGPPPLDYLWSSWTA